MSRHPTRRLSASRRTRSLAAVVAAALTGLALLPGAVTAQPGTVEPKDIEIPWQLLEYRDGNGRIQAVPPGVSVTFLPFASVISGDAACSSYRAAYAQTPQSIAIQPPEVERVSCDPSSQAVDDAFYDAMAIAASLSLEGDEGGILTVYDVVGDPLLTFTSAQIPLDPTIARWELARLGQVDGSIEQIRGIAPEMEFLRGGGAPGGLTGRVVGSTGCGSFLGSYRTFDSTIRISDVDYRLAGCTSELARQAEAFIDTLAQITDFNVLPAGLSLEDSDGITRLALVPQIDLGDRIWTPTTVLDENGDALSLSDRLQTSAVQFLGGSAEGRSICRSFDGRSIRSGLALNVYRVRSAEGRCPAARKPGVTAPLDVETAFLGALARTASHALRGEELELLDPDGAPVMRLRPQADLVGPTWVLTRLDTDTRVARRGRRPAIAGSEPTAIFTGIELIKGDTGVESRGIANEYTALYATPGAAQIQIFAPDVGNACQGRRRAGTKVCIQERTFLGLLQSVDGYIVQETELRLLDGPEPVLWFQPE